MQKWQKKCIGHQSRQRNRQEMKDIKRKLDAKGKRRVAHSTNRADSTSINQFGEHNSQGTTLESIPDIKSRNTIRKLNTNTNRKWEKSIYTEMQELKRK